MTWQDRLMKNLLFFGVALYYLGGYFFLNWFSSRRSSFHELALPFEKDLPFVPVLIFAYLLIYAFLATSYLAVDDLSYFKKIVKSFFILITIHYVFFLVFPVRYSLRPVVDEHQGFVENLVVFYYWVDLPYNCFPSMHISNVFLISFFLQRYRKFWGRILVPLACLVAVSVVLVKQHYIADVVAGLLVAGGVFKSVFGPLSFPSRRTSQTMDGHLAPTPH